MRTVSRLSWSFDPVVPSAPAGLSSIAIIACHFGPLRPDFDLWLAGCARNPTVDWVVLTDDRASHAYPPNVHVVYQTLDDLRERLQARFDFPVALERPYKLKDFCPAFGEAFATELSAFAWWGWCDFDLVWGDIRRFLTEDVLAAHEKIGFVGNFTLCRNDAANNRRYRDPGRAGKPLYREAFASRRHACFDEVGINDIFLTQGARVYREAIFADLAANRCNFAVCFRPREDATRNRGVAFLWENGRLFQLFEEGDACGANRSVGRRELLFTHFLGSRVLDVQVRSDCERFLVVPWAYLPLDEGDALKPGTVEIGSLDPAWLRARTRPQWPRFWLRAALRRRPPFIFARGLFRALRYNWWMAFRPDVYNYWTWAYDPADRTHGRMRLLPPESEALWERAVRERAVAPDTADTAAEPGASLLPKISVIIPVYNVNARLVRRCLASVVLQTWRDFEAVLVDDGSEPSYADLYQRACVQLGIHYLHRAHAGLSVARNEGLDATSAPLVAFVDGDDYVEPAYLERLHAALVSADADIAVCTFGRRYADGTPFKTESPGIDRAEVVSGQQALERLARDHHVVNVASWNKLYRRELFDEIRFPAGRLHEDEFALPRLLHAARRVAYIPDRLYWYVRRPGSITASIPPLNTDQVDSGVSFLSFVREHAPAFEGSARNYLAARCVDTLARVSRAAPSPGRTAAHARALEPLQFPGCLRDRDLGCLEKAKVALVVTVPSVYRVLRKLRNIGRRALAVCARSRGRAQ